MSEATRIAFGNTERAAAILQQDGAPPELDAASIVDLVNSGKWRIKATEIPFLTSMIEQAALMDEFLQQCRWELLSAPAGTGFILSDNPLTLVPPPGADTYRTGLGFGIPGVEKLLPLTRSLCLRIGDQQDYTIAYKQVDKSTVRLINQKIAANAERFVFGPDRYQLNNIIDRCQLKRRYRGHRTGRLWF